MSASNGDRARYQKDRKRKMIHRQRIQALMAGVRARAATAAAPPAEAAGSLASAATADEGGSTPARD